MTSIFMPWIIKHAFHLNDAVVFTIKKMLFCIFDPICLKWQSNPKMVPSLSFSSLSSLYCKKWYGFPNKSLCYSRWSKHSSYSREENIFPLVTFSFTWSFVSLWPRANTGCISPLNIHADSGELLQIHHLDSINDEYGLLNKLLLRELAYLLV